MVRTIVTVVLLILLVVGCWWIYKAVTGNSSLGSGEVYVQSTSSKDAMSTGATYVDGKPIEAHPTPSRSDAPGTINTEPVAQYGEKGYTGYSGANGYSGYPATNTPETYQYGRDGFYDRKPGDNSDKFGKSDRYDKLPPATFQQSYFPQSNTDTLPANPPNGYAYAGTGAYELYRQGDLTYRMDTKTGASCVLYATLEEWRKPLVYGHGCGSRWWRSSHHER
ncbi:MAG TPA: hypothetical protein VGN16_02960 [Acidobacteriaceae bacterium]|jgi:hypothetical protein